MTIRRTYDFPFPGTAHVVCRVTVKYIGPTDTKGSRYVCAAYSVAGDLIGRKVVSYDYAGDRCSRHLGCVKATLEKVLAAGSFYAEKPFASFETDRDYQFLIHVGRADQADV